MFPNQHLAGKPSESTELPAVSLMDQAFKNRTEKIPEGSDPVPAVLRCFPYTKTPQGAMLNILYMCCQCFSGLKAQPQCTALALGDTLVGRKPTRKVQGCNSGAALCPLPFPHMETGAHLSITPVHDFIKDKLELSLRSDRFTALQVKCLNVSWINFLGVKVQTGLIKVTHWLFLENDVQLTQSGSINEN